MTILNVGAMNLEEFMILGKKLVFSNIQDYYHPFIV